MCYLTTTEQVGLGVPYHGNTLDPLTSRIAQKLKRFESENKDKARSVYPSLKGFCSMIAPERDF